MDKPTSRRRKRRVMPLNQLYDYRLSDGSFGFKKGQHGCRGGCEGCYLDPQETKTDANQALPVLTLPNWNDPKIRAHLLLDGISVPCQPWIKHDPVAQSNWKSFPWRLMRNEFAWGTLLGDICDLDEVRGEEEDFYYIRETIRLANEEGKSRLIVFSTRCLSLRRDLVKLLRFFKTVPNLIILLGVTGNRRYEVIQPETHIRTLWLAKEEGVINQFATTRYPHTEGACDDSILPEIARTGVTHYLVRGRWLMESDQENMSDDVNFGAFVGHENTYHIPTPAEAVLMRRIADAGLTNMPLLDFLMEKAAPLPRVELTEAEAAADYDEIAVDGAPVGVDPVQCRINAIRRRMLPYIPRKTW